MREVWSGTQCAANGGYGVIECFVLGSCKAPLIEKICTVDVTDGCRDRVLG